MDFTKLNSASRLDETPPTKKMSELEVGKKYDVTVVKIVNTRYDERVVATINDEFVIFLPARIGKFLKENPDQLTQMVDASREKRLQMLYHGGQYNRCEFCYKI
jgi:hypothetical protein